MKNDKPMFKNVLHYGDLYSECILYTFNDKALCAIVTNNRNSRFIAISTDNYGSSNWIIASITAQEIILIMRGRLSLFELVKNAKDILFVHEYTDYKYESVNFDELDEDMLPSKDSTMNLKGEIYNQYIKKLHDENTIKMKVKKHGSTVHNQIYEVINCGKYSFRDYLYNDGFPILIAVCDNHVVFSCKEYPYDEECDDENDISVIEIDSFIGFIKSDLDYTDSIDRFELEIIE